MEAIRQMQTGVRRHRLILVVGPSGSGKTALLRLAAKTLAAPLLNINLRVSARLHEVPRSRHPYEVGRIVGRMIADTASGTVFLDNLEMLFAPELQLDPLLLLENESRNRLLIASWAGRLEGEALVYAEPDHPEYRRYTNFHAHLISVGGEV